VPACCVNRSPPPTLKPRGGGILAKLYERGSSDMNYTQSEVLQFVQENDVKFVRLAFCDIFGKQKNISIMADELPRAFESGISFDASAVQGFMNISKSDLLLFPDAKTLAVLPWRPTGGRVIRLFCSIKHPDGATFEGDIRNLLVKATKKASEMGYVCKIGAESEFYLFNMDENGEATKIPFDNAGYLDIAPLDKGENVRREICLSLEEMGIIPISSQHQEGPGQNEIDFKYSDALSTADNFITFKAAVKTIATKNGLYASFLPKPLYGKSGSGLHINISLFKNNDNIFKSDSVYAKDAESFIAGIINHIAEITAFLNPTVNSYERFGEFEAPKYITWSHQNHSQLIRIPTSTGKYARMELRSADSTCNPYMAFALLLYAGLNGIEKSIPLCKPIDENLYEADLQITQQIPTLPMNLSSALKLARESDFVKTILPKATLDKFIIAKTSEIAAEKEKIENEYFAYY